MWCQPFWFYSIYVGRVQPYKVVDRQVPLFCFKTLKASLSLDCIADTWSPVDLCSFNANLTHFNTVFFEPQGDQAGQVQNPNVSQPHTLWHTLLCRALVRTHHTSWCIFSKFIHLSKCPHVDLLVLSQEFVSVPVFDLRWIRGCQWFYHGSPLLIKLDALCLAAHFVDVDLARPVRHQAKHFRWPTLGKPTPNMRTHASSNPQGLKSFSSSNCSTYRPKQGASGQCSNLTIINHPSSTNHLINHLIIDHLWFTGNHPNLGVRPRRGQSHGASRKSSMRRVDW